MSLTLIEGIENNKGYNDFVSFVNKELTNPTLGLHNAFIDNLVNTVVNQDYFCFLGELYNDSQNYYGCFVVDNMHRLLVIENSDVIYLNVNTSQVEQVFNMGYFGLKEFYSNKIPLFTKDTNSATDKSFEINGTLEFGNETYYTYLVEDNLRIKFGRISSQELLSQSLGNYNIKVDKLDFDIITLVAQRDYLTKFQIKIAGKVVQDFEYSYLGQMLYVQDTMESRIDIRRLEREGVISSNL